MGSGFAPIPTSMIELYDRTPTGKWVQKWVTQKENVRHAVEMGRMDQRKKRVVCAKVNGEFVREFESITKAVEWLKGNINPKARKSPISACCKNKKHYNTAYGFKWYAKN